MANSKPTKRLLLLTDWYEPAHRGGGLIRSSANLAQLLKAELEVFVLTRDRDFQADTALPGIQADAWQSVEGVQVRYVSPRRLGWRQIRALWRGLAPDAVYVKGLWSWYFSILPLFLSRWGGCGGKLLIAPEGMLQAGALQFKPFKKRVFLFLARRAGLYQWPALQATDEQEREDIQRHLGPGLRVAVVPNVPALLPFHAGHRKQPGHLRLLYLSRVTPKKNLAFLLRLLQDPPTAGTWQLDIVGAEEDARYAALCRGLCAQLPPTVQVRWHGAQPFHALYAYWERADVFVLPTFGENYGHAIAEALSVGLPAVLSDQTPWQDLSAEGAGWALPLARPDAFREVLEKLMLMDDGAFQAMRCRARRYAEQHSGRESLRRAYIGLLD